MMNKRQKQELFDAITSVGYKETEIRLLQYLNGDAIQPDDNFMTILAWFNLWFNKGDYENELQSIVSFIQTNTYTNPSKNTKKVKTEISDDFRKAWKEKFGVDIKD
jgi:hypothetical protein